ncbi:protein PMR5 [Malania oleifera]|uniref:protein PMR5 n=1 Tax=Malania oleifera TaxID=397392 RepID=UPI0025AE800F|nr:protein PMR5 [Malania oleifera]
MASYLSPAREPPQMALPCFPFSSSLSASCFPLLFLLLVQPHFANSALLLSLKSHFLHRHHHSARPLLQANQSTCSLFVGSWVRDTGYGPLYQSNCPAIDPQFNCQLYGRPDSDYLQYRWQPFNCELPSFDGLEFLGKMQGKTMMFVGDSLGRNQWESLACMISAAVPQSQTQLDRGDPLSTFKFLDYGVTISYYKATYLVDIDLVQGKRVLRLEDISGNSNAWRNADVLSFNTGHWWSHRGSLQGWDYIEYGGKFYQDMDRLAAFERGLKTWAAWVDSNIDTTRTRLFFQSISPTHYGPSDWNTAVAPVLMSTKNCYGETAPSGATYSATYPGGYTDLMDVVDKVIGEMRNPVYLLDITMLSEMRKDGHPSIYSGDLSPGQRANPGQSADCSHWCLPGLPDTWNQLFYTLLFY